tara:strand:+ start:1334 stop:2560 length:1227 start_codon:yes stop_codon:yes gene_type:complete
MTTQRHRIPEHNLPYLEKEIDKFNRRAAKLSAEPITYRVEEADVGPLMDLFLDRVTVAVMHVWVVIEQALSQAEGEWGLVARLSQAKGDQKNNGHRGVVVRHLTRWEDGTVPAEFHDVDRVHECDYCEQNRRRKGTYVVHNRVTGQYRRVGSTCMDKFFEDDNALALAQLAELFKEVEEKVKQAARGELAKKEEYGIIRPHYPLTDFVRAACSHAYSSAGEVAEKAKRDVEDGLDTTAHESEAAEIIDWARNIHGNTDYENNLRTAYGFEYIDSSLAGIVASGVLQHRKAQRLSQQASANEFTGDPGVELEAVAQVESVKTFASKYPPYGKAAMHALKLPDGRQLVWFASPREQWMQEGQIVQLQGRIHRHTTYKGLKQTQVNKLTWTIAGGIAFAPMVNALVNDEAR